MNSPPSDPFCPFCAIASSYPPIPPSSAARTAIAVPSTTAGSSLLPKTETAAIEYLNYSNADGDQLGVKPIEYDDDINEAKAYLVLSTRHVLAFLDIMPLTRGHVLLITRGHWEKLGHVSVQVGREIGKWLPILSRVVMRTVLGKDIPDTDAHWNVVQNNGARAAQVVPHIHFHIIPRPPADPALVTDRPGWVMFGRGQREELDDEEGEELAQLLREELVREVDRIRQSEQVDLDADPEASGASNSAQKMVKL